MAKASKLHDTLVVYFDDVDDCWVGHSLRTDQVGTGDCVVDALADVIKAVDAICAAAAKDRTLAVRRDAPREVQAMARSAKALPKEIFGIAHRMARGDWPSDLAVDAKPHGKSARFTAQFEEVCR